MPVGRPRNWREKGFETLQKFVKQRFFLLEKLLWSVWNSPFLNSWQG